MTPSNPEEREAIQSIPDELVAYLTRLGYKLSEYNVYFDGDESEGMRDIIGTKALKKIADYISAREQRKAVEARIEENQFNIDLAVDHEFTEDALVLIAGHQASLKERLARLGSQLHSSRKESEDANP